MLPFAGNSGKGELSAYYCSIIFVLIFVWSFCFVFILWSVYFTCCIICKLKLSSLWQMLWWSLNLGLELIILAFQNSCSSPKMPSSISHTWPPSSHGDRSPLSAGVYAGSWKTNIIHESWEFQQELIQTSLGQIHQLNVIAQL